MNSQTQMMSSACQNRAKQSRRRSHAGAKVADGDLDHHHDQPDQSGGDVQAVAADKGEEGGQKGAALRGRAAGDHVGELVQLETEEAAPSTKVTAAQRVGLGTASRR